MTIRQCIEPDEDVDVKFQDFVREIVGVRDGGIDNGAQYWEKCFSSMSEIEGWLHHLADRQQGADVIGQSPTSEFQELIELQRASLVRQHEILAVICTYLVKLGYPAIQNLQSLLTKLKSIDKYDIILVHYIPICGSLINHLASLEGSCTLREARSLHQTLAKGKDGEGWALRSLHAAVLAWWLAEYSGRYVDNPIGSPLRGVDLEAEAEERSDLFMTSLRDGAFHFQLSICQDIKPSPWHDPARVSLVSFLLQDTTTLSSDSPQPSDFFQAIVMEQFQSFTESFISNMPDTIRRLRTEEDEQRRQLGSRFQRGPVEYELHLERFLLIVCFAYEGSPEAGHTFWSEPDGNLQGFLQWAARRQATPRVAAFCEMLRAISLGEECALAAHKFLEDSSVATGKLRRTNSLSYSLIFSELKYYSDHLNERGTSTQASTYNSVHTPANQIAEPESAMMLESYLRLLAHLCSQSTAAREFVKSYPGVNVISTLFSLASFSVESRLRASIFSALTALLTNKSKEFGDIMWNSLDTWINSVLSTTKSGALPIALPQEEEYIWLTLSEGYEESNSFVELLRSLIAASTEQLHLNDALPFPEYLGAASRKAGIDRYVDFVLGRVFASENSALRPNQQQVLRWNCLNFINTCLSTFNEDLVFFANKTNIAVDSVMETSDLSTYIRLHPFTRVMEWFFNQKVLTALFSTAHQNVGQVNDATPDSPLVASLFLSIEVMSKVIELQAVYLDIVRPLIKANGMSRNPIAHSAIASFEDAILNNINLVVDLGLYCGTGHQDLTIASLKLLEKLSTSRKLVAPLQLGHRSDRNRIITAVEKDHEADRISRALSTLMHLDIRELERGPSSPGYLTKLTVLNFLNASLRASPNRASLAHVLLGFSCHQNILTIEDDGLFARGESLFHAILQLAVFYPDGDSDSYQSWLTDLKRNCFDVCRQLWASPLSSTITLNELRANNFAFDIILKQKVVNVDSLWDGQIAYDPTFYDTEAAICFQNVLRTRCSFYDYLARELRQLSQNKMASLLSQLQNSLLGSTIMPNGDQMANASIFDLFDFMQVEVDQEEVMPEQSFLKGLPFKICRKDETGPYDISSAAQLIILRRNELKLAGHLTVAAEDVYREQAEALLGYFARWNRRQATARLKLEVLRGWVKAVIVMLESCEFDGDTRILFILQTVQLILPHLEAAYDGDIVTAVELLSLAKCALQHVDFSSFTFADTQNGDFANDKLLQLFKATYAGIYSAVTAPEMREVCYQIAYKYLRNSEGRPQLGKLIIRAVKSAGDQPLDVVCDDAYAGHGICRVAALLLLDTLVSISAKQESSYVLTKLVKYNFIAVLIEVLKTMPMELRSAKATGKLLLHSHGSVLTSVDVPFLLSYYEATLSLLLRIAQTRAGAGHILNAGLFQSITESGIFAADPDIGLGE